jgi:hypothetical protein
MAAQAFEVIIRMPQHQVTGDGSLGSHKIRKWDGHSLPSQGVSQSGCCFPDMIGDGDLGEGM